MLVTEISAYILGERFLSAGRKKKMMSVLATNINRYP